jgi:ubiquinone/menaquinone biosynthesis C-methylase UbiE
MDTRASLIEGYNRSAPTYDETAGMIYLGVLRKFLPRLRVVPSPAILDLGCGTGINLLEAARVLGPCAQLHGVDLAPGMIVEARRKASGAGVSATFEVGDAEHLALPDASFDLVICNGVYHWFPHRSQAIAEISRVLRPNGQALVICVAEPGFHEWVRVVDMVRSRLLKEQRPWLPALPTPAELMANLRAANLTLEHLEYEVDPLMVPDAHAFLRIMTVIAPTWLAGVPSDGADAVMTAVSEGLSGSGNPFVITGAGLVCVSRKLVS